MDCSNIRIATDRLILLSADVGYAPAVLSEYKYPVTLYMNHPPADGIVTLEARMIERKKHMEQGLMLYLIVLLRKNLEFIGSFALEDLKEANPEMGGWLKKGAQGQGYGKEIVTALKAWSDDHLNYQYIIWHCAQANVASCKLAELLNGRTVRAYRKTNQTGYTWDYLEYHIPK